METPQSTQGQVFISNLFQAGPMQMDPLVSANIQFALDLFKHLDEVDKTVNLFVSPFSISAALAMVHLGAKGTTASQMAEEFLEASEKYYQAGLGAVDFVNGAEEARKEINTWIEAQTAGKIKNVFAKHSLKSSMKLILVNATYFRGNWSKQFDKRNTFSGQFKLNQNQVKNVEMMQRTEDFNFIYIHEVATKIIELPYLQDELSMVILLPDDVNGLENLQRSFTLDRLRNWTNPENMYKAKVRVTLPKFKLEEKYDLTLILSRMGMVDAFHGLKANLSGMSRSNDLSLSKVIHQSFVEVNEEGTEAAAVTVISFLKRAVVAREEFMADHPFLFFIRHKKTQSILFYGRLNSP
ncbi:leukocyte elastase inhibitor-like isoform X2 [Pristis pectinata]|uniref:leukocyte elastase inhibitor-like isoform X2 n=1 Tax=Pristis pectinata TaxID=685728 RepID=UPI00223E0421|nr:leukocyte elastase inhibitor-like isoform X2 [Pristis pectinata]